VTPGTVAVRNARIHDAHGDALAARIRVARLLAAADVATGLPRGSLLIVRRLDDPLPGMLCADRHALRPPSSWVRALGVSIAEIARTAARPARGVVPAGANAVFFADEAELLACLGFDVADETAGDRWWWRDVIAPGIAPRTALARALVERAHAVPAALEQLAAARALARVAAVLDEEAAHEVARAVAARFAVALAPAPAGERESSPRAQAPAGRVPSIRSFADAVAAAAPEALQLTASVAVRRLVALALVVRRAPALAHAQRFAQALADAVPPVDPRVEGTAMGTPPVARAAAPARGIGGAGARGDAPRQAPYPPRVAEARAGPETGRVVPAPPTQTAPTTEEPVPVAADRGPLPAVATELAGVLFLTNVVIALGLYGDFTQPRDPGIGVDFWHLLSLLGKRLLGRRPVARDPLWALLRELAGPDAPDAPNVDRLVACLAPRVRRQLRPCGVRADVLLRRPGHIAVSETRVDTTFDLAAQPIEIRLAGLDRDPGFVPAAGRTIAFHFA
jgi:hypothetical protein